MNMQSVNYTPLTETVSSGYCICRTPVIHSIYKNREPSLYCKKCGKLLRLQAIKDKGKRELMMELKEINEAKANIRSTLKLQKERMSERSEELEFLLKRL